MENKTIKRSSKNRFIDLTGQRFNKLIVIEWVGTSKRGRYAMWRCKCDCGNECIVTAHNLKTKSTQSCGCLYRKPPYKWLYNNFINSAKNTHRQCDITYEQFLNFTNVSKCHYCGHEITWSKHRWENGKYYSSKYNLDRKDNNKGYSVENCVVCCIVCNRIKSNIFNYDEMIIIGKMLSLKQIK